MSEPICDRCGGYCESTQHVPVTHSERTTRLRAAVDAILAGTDFTVGEAYILGAAVLKAIEDAMGETA